MVAGPSVLRFREAFPARMQYGEKLRLQVLQGEANTFKYYCLMGNRVTLGRDDSSDIPLYDKKASRNHAELRWEGRYYSVNDLDSANGVLLNEKKTSSGMLKPGDLITIGLTIIEVVEAGKIKGRRRSPDGGAVKSHVDAVKRDDPAVQKKTRSRALIMGLGILFMFYVMLIPEDSPTLKQLGVVKFTDQTERRNLVRKLKKQNKKFPLVPPSDKKDTPRRKSANVLFKKAMREYTNRNFRRAISDYETAITVDPDHELAKMYLEIAKSELEKEVESTYKAAVKARRAGRLREARMHYTNVLRLLEAEPHNTRFVETEEALKQLDKLEQIY